MACSCKSNGTSSINNPVQNKAQFIYNADKKIYNPYVIPKQQKIAYDFSSTTQPTQYCINCIQKHLSVCVALIERGGIVSKLVATGQLLLAAQHYAEQNKALSLKCYYTGLQMLQNIGDVNVYLPKIKELLRNTCETTDVQEQQWWSYVEVPKLTSSTTYWSYPFACLLQLCGAYGLVFTQLTYQMLNKAFAVGKLGMIATQYVKIGKNKEAQKLRHIYKKMQEITGRDIIYMQVRQQLQDFIKDEYESCKQNPQLIIVSKDNQ